MHETNQTSAIITRTIDGVMRLWASVVDEPSCMRVWFTIDSDVMLSKQEIQKERKKSQYHYLDASEMRMMMQASLQWLQRDLQVIEMAISEEPHNEREVEAKRSRAKRLEHLINETPDMFALIDMEGHLIIRALANLDRRPPTLCQSFIVLKMDAPPLARLSGAVYSITAHAQATSQSSVHDTPSGMLILTLDNGDICKFLISPSLLFDGLGQGLTSLGLQCMSTASKSLLRSTHSNPIRSLVDQANGEGFFSVSKSGGIIQWKAVDNLESQMIHPRRLHRISSNCRVLAAGRDTFTWYQDGKECSLLFFGNGFTFRHRLLGVQDSLSFLHIEESPHCIVVVGGEAGQAMVHLWKFDRDSLESHDTNKKGRTVGLELTAPIQLYFLVSHQTLNAKSIQIGCADTTGSITIWSISLLDGDGGASKVTSLCLEAPAISSIRCSTDARLAVMVDAHTIEIYDSRQAYLSTKAEAILSFDDEITSFAWSHADSVGISMLAVSMQSLVKIICCRRMSYIDTILQRPEPNWIVICKVDLSHISTDAISSICWLTNGSLIVAISNCILRYDGTITYEDSQLQERQSHLKLLTLEQAGELEDYHPEVLAQCLLWDRLDLASEILGNVSAAIDEMNPIEFAQGRVVQWNAIVDERSAGSRDLNAVSRQA